MTVRPDDLDFFRGSALNSVPAALATATGAGASRMTSAKSKSGSMESRSMNTRAPGIRSLNSDFSKRA
jgi:hypothetical protein